MLKLCICSLSAIAVLKFKGDPGVRKFSDVFSIFRMLIIARMPGQSSVSRWIEYLSPTCPCASLRRHRCALQPPECHQLLSPTTSVRIRGSWRRSTGILCSRWGETKQSIDSHEPSLTSFRRVSQRPSPARPCTSFLHWFCQIANPARYHPRGCMVSNRQFQWSPKNSCDHQKASPDTCHL